ncbi:EcsC family protein [Acinetobacter zhairhuonensis]|uniref:EcsC family protein n=1 Tax=Acinetobacter sp. A7.4 TaxID=2919921 RepID=UPI001F4FEB3A|nr:EcsC family protein [Acinetobacter sp. A7.4]MCJ8163070.1 EcsC family protein [Acinetobacter sp. A7.4]
MTEANNKQSTGFLSNAFGVAKKLSQTGIDVLQHVAPGSVAAYPQGAGNSAFIEGKADSKLAFDKKKYQDAQQILREHLPQVSRQLLGRHYSKVNNVASFVAPQYTDKISDYFFERLNAFSSDISSVDDVLDQAGVKDLETLTQDVDRSKRISQALAEQNKWIASLQGMLTGATGTLGSSVDIPLSLILSLRTIYQVGRAYGFELNKDTEQDIVQFIFKQIDLGLIAEKQTLLMALKALSQMLQTHDIGQLQHLLGSSNDIETLKKWLHNEQGDYKWAWMNKIPNYAFLSKLTPVAGATLSAVYSWKLIEDVNQKAQVVFAQARQYIQQHKDVELSVVTAYERSLVLLAQAAPKLLTETVQPSLVEAESFNDATEVTLDNHQNIAKVRVKRKTAAKPRDDTAQQQKIEEGLEKLAGDLVEPHDKVQQQSALSPQALEVMVDGAVEQIENPLAEPVVAAKRPRKTPAKRVTKKTTPPTEQ